MCLIAVSPKGTQKYSEFFLNGIRKAAVTNTDGIGYSFKRSGSNRVWIAKGFKDVEKFITCLKHKRLKDNDELVVHLRIGNKGAKNTDMNHPFVLSNKPDEILTNDSYVNAITMCHNGTFYDYGDYNSIFSDTFFFVKDFMSVPEIQQLLKRSSTEFKAVFKGILRSNRLAFIFPDDTPLITIGEFKEDEGYLFSNESYKRERYSNIGGRDYWEGGYSELNSHRQRIPLNDDGVRAVGPASPIRVDESDEDERIQRIIRSNSGTIDKNSREAIAERLRKLTEGQGVNKSVEKRDQNGYLPVNSKIDIIPPIGAPTFVDALLAKVYYLAMEDTVYVPLKFVRAQFTQVKWVPREFNYKHFTFHTERANIDKNIVGGQVYKMVEFGGDKGVHTLQPLGSSHPNSMIFLKTIDLLQYSTPRTKGEYSMPYFSLYRLIQKFTPSKTLFNHVEKAITSIEGKQKNPENIKFKALEHLDLMGLKLFYNYMTTIVYPKAYGESIRKKVQESDILVN